MFRLTARRRSGVEEYAYSSTANLLTITQGGQIHNLVELLRIRAVRDTARPSLGRPGISSLAPYSF